MRATVPSGMKTHPVIGDIASGFASSGVISGDQHFHPGILHRLRQGVEFGQGEELRVGSLRQVGGLLEGIAGESGLGIEAKTRRPAPLSTARALCGSWPD